MARFTRRSRFPLLATILAVALLLGIVVTVPAQVQAQLNPGVLSRKLPAQWEFRPPGSSREPAPENTEAGGTRGGCNQQEDKPVLLVPASKVGATAAQYPTFSWYMPQTSAQKLEFSLQDAAGNDIYSTEYVLAAATGVANAPSISSLTLPAYANLPPLEIGQDYQWNVELICDAGDRSGDVIVSAGIKRVNLNSALALRLGQATPQERVALYADARLWYDALNTLADLRRKQPSDTELADAWDKLLNSAELVTISKKSSN